MIEDEELSISRMESDRASGRARQLEENSISVPERKRRRPSGGRVEWEETRTFVHRPSLVVSIPSMEVDDAKKNLNHVPPV